jgi:hypothetical protein
MVGRSEDEWCGTGWQGTIWQDGASADLLQAASFEETN